MFFPELEVKLKPICVLTFSDGERMKAIFREYQPEIIFHLAAQPLVRLSYEIPVDTLAINVMGTII